MKIEDIMKIEKLINGNRTAIIILHEIYGINDFIRKIGQQYHKEGYDVFCPNFYQKGLFFPYAQAQVAYGLFMDSVGFDVYKKVNKLVNELKLMYQAVYVIGFSVGATIAWRCSENKSCDGVICCYGSRIRDYLMVAPQCPVLLAFAKLDSFDVSLVASKLQQKDRVEVEILDAKHGFVDMFSGNYSTSQAQKFDEYRINFLTKIKKL